MRSKAPLAMMEQMVMILVFALAAALCLQAFVTSDRMSRESEARDRAAVLCQNTAEAIRYSGGDLAAAAELLGAGQWADGVDALTIFYDTNWQFAQPASSGVYYTLGACRMKTDVPGLGKAGVWVQEDETGTELFRLEVCWQEEVSARD